MDGCTDEREFLNPVSGLEPEPATDAGGTVDFQCPSCGSLAAWEAIEDDASCPACSNPIASEGGVRLLVKDLESVERQLGQARASERSPWYEERQSHQFTGPYRYHMAKRRRYLDETLDAFAGERGARFGAALDLGCGDGGQLNWLAGHADVVYGSDYNLTRLMRAAETPDARIFMADLTDHPAADDSFDLIFFNHVIEHVPDDLAGLSELRRILAPGGLAVIGTPNEGAAFWRLAYRLQPSARRTTDHVHFYTADTLATRCRQAGLRVLDVHPIGWGLPHFWLDAKVRGRRGVDDGFERVGRRFLPSQATSLYAIVGR